MASKKTKKNGNGNGHKKSAIGTTTVAIDKGIPIPSKNKWPFEQLEVGDSFVVPSDSRSAAASAMYQFKKRNKGSEFVLRKTDEEGKHRVWRTA